MVKGNKHSEETKRKMSLSRKGNKNALGNKHTEETKKKIGTASKGNTYGRMLKGRTGENANHWKGGISKIPKYDRYRNREYRRKQRNIIIEALGGKCVRCGFADKRALQIDHINGGGSKERKERNFEGQFHGMVLKSFLNAENKYQLLCANCNWIKRFENNEHRNQVV